jgi:hypothetical protein
MKLLIIEFLPASCYFLPLGSKHSQHPVLKHPQSQFVPSATPMRTYMNNYSFVFILILTFIYSRREEKNILNWMKESTQNSLYS